MDDSFETALRLRCEGKVIKLKREKLSEYPEIIAVGRRYNGYVLHLDWPSGKTECIDLDIFFQGIWSDAWYLE